MKRGNILKGFTLSILLAGCATVQQPTEQMTASQAAIRAAEEVGAQQAPEAQLHLKLAREQAEEARRLMADGQNKRAQMVLARSQADAELAIALAKETSMRTEAQETMDELRRLQGQLPGSTTE